MQETTTIPTQVSTGISGSNLESGQGSVVSPYSAPSPVSVISTNQGKAAFQAYQDQHANDMAALRPDDSDAANKGVTAANQSKDATAFAKSMGGLSPEEASALKIDTSGYDWNSAANMYVPKTGISTDPVKAKADIAAQNALAKVNSAFDVQKATYDGATANVVSKIQSIYSDLIKETTQFNKSTDAYRTTSGIKTGGARYAQDVNGGILTATANAGLQKLVDLQTKEATAISEAESANAKQQLSLFAEKQKEVNSIRDERTKILNTLQTEATKMQANLAKNKAQANTDQSISKLLAEGITDPAAIMEKLNYDENGNQVGSVTAKDVSSSLKALAPGGDIQKLSAATRDFFILKGHNQLPTSVSSLPDDQQLFAYLSQQKEATSATGSSGKVITLSSAKSLNLPISTVGMTEKDIAKSLEDSTPPHWFSEKLQSEKKMSVLPDVIQSTWDTYRQSFSAEKAASGSKTTAGGKTKNTPPPSLVGTIRAMKSKGASTDEMNQVIQFKGYDFAADDPAFK